MAVGLSIQHGDRPERWVLHGAWQAEYAARIRRSGILALEINPARGFVGEDLEFLKDIPELEILEVIDHHLVDDTGVGHCETLQRLVLNTYAKTSPDFSRLSQLTDLYIEWRQAASAVYDQVQYKRLRIQSFPETDLSALRALTGLTRLAVADARGLASLTGLERLARLEFLGVYRAPKLRSLKGVEALHRLLALEIQQCRDVDSLDSIAGLTTLRRLLFAENGTIPTLAPLAEMRQLEEFHFYGSSKVKDGAIRQLLDLPNLRKVSLQNRRHYDISARGLEEILGRRA